MRNARFIVIVLVWAILPAACATGPNGGAYQAYAKGDYRTALAELLPLAEQGDDEAQRLGREFRPEAEHRKVLAALRPQAEQGKAEAQRQLASMYYKGQGGSRDYDQAFAWYRKAADQGDALAQSNLGYLYAMGQGVRQDYREAAAWYWRAAIQGNAVAQYRLGVLFEKGQGVAQSEVQALTYYILAAARAYPQAVVDRDRLTSSLAAAQINEAQRLAREFRDSGL